MRNDNGVTLTVSIDVPLEPAAAFTAVVEELRLALGRAAIEFDASPNGRVIQANFRDPLELIFD